MAENDDTMTAVEEVESTSNAADEQEFVEPTEEVDESSEVDAGDSEQVTEETTEGEETAEPTAEGEQESEPAAQQEPGLSAEDIELAHKAGFTDEFMTSLGIKNRNQLEYVAGMILQQRGQAQAGAQQPKPANETQQVAESKVESPSVVNWDELSADYDDKLVSVLKGLESRSSQLQSIPQQIIAQVQNELMAPIVNELQHLRMERFDNYVSGLGPQWKDVFGDGSTLDLDQKSDAMQNRQKLLRAAQTILSGRASVGGRQTFDKQLFEVSLAQAFGKQMADKAVTETRQKIVKGLDKQKGRTLIKPGGVNRTAQTSKTPNLDATLAAMGYEENDD